MELLLIILKIIGIVLVCIIALLLILILFVLFVPFRYKYKFKYNDEKNNENCHFVDLTWIFRIIRLKVFISLTGVDYEFRIFGIRCRFVENIIKKNKLDEDVEYEDDLYSENFWEEDETIKDDYSYEESIIPNAKDYENMNNYDELNDIDKYSNKDNSDNMVANEINDRIILEKVAKDDVENDDIQDDVNIEKNKDGYVFLKVKLLMF